MPASSSTSRRRKRLKHSASRSAHSATALWNVWLTPHLQNNVAAQPLAQRGDLTQVPVTEANNTLRIGRFGWKAQHASLVSFSGDAYLNEMGITNPFDGFGGRSSSAPDAGTHENPATTPGGVINVTFPSAFDPVEDPEDDGLDVLAFADFMAATRAPRRGPITAAVTRGDPLFNSVGCAVCHTRTFVTAAPGTLINGGAFAVPAALGNKIIHPFSDFALHNVGTGDGIVQNAGQGLPISCARLLYGAFALATGSCTKVSPSPSLMRSNCMPARQPQRGIISTR